MMQDLVHRLAMSGARCNGEPARDLVAAPSDPPPVGSVVVVRETDVTELLRTVVAAWSHGAVPLLSHRPLADAPWWRGGDESFVVPDAVARWGVSPECGLLQATSGSTGNPSLVQRSVASLVWESSAYEALFSAAEDTKRPVVHCITPQHSLGIGLTLGPLLSGRSVVATAPVRAHRLAATTPDAVVAGTPSTLRLLLTALPQGPRPDGTVFCGAGRTDAELEERVGTRWPGVTLLRGFGSTETGGVLAGTRGLGRPVPGVSLVAEPPTQGGAVQLEVRLPHPVLGPLDGHEPSDTWSFPDLVRQGPDGQLEHVARVARSLRLREQDQALVGLGDELARLGRDWRLVDEGPSATSGDGPVLVVEGLPLAPSEVRRLQALGGALAVSTLSVRVLEVFPRDALGKVALRALVAP